MLPHTLHGIGIWWSSPYLIWKSYSYGPPTWTYGPPTCEVTLPWLYGIDIVWFPYMYVWSSHKWSVFVSYMPVMVPPYLIWDRYGMVTPHVHMVPPTCMIWCQWLLCSPHILYWVGIWWSSPYLIWNSYHMVPHMYIWSSTCEVSSCLILLLWSIHTLYGIGIMVPHMYIWSPHMWGVFQSYMTLMAPHTSFGIAIVWSPHMYYMTDGPPYLIWNRYLMDPLFSYMEQLLCGPPTVHMVPLTLYGTAITWSPTCLHDSYGPSIPYME